MPIDDVNNLAKYKAMIENATTLNDLEDAYNMLTAAYQRGDMSYQAYMSVYAMYEAKHAVPVAEWHKTATKLSDVDVTGMPEIEAPEAGYRRGLTAAGMATGLGSGEFGQYLRSRFAPTFALFGAQGALRGDVGTDPQAFQKYAQQTRGGGLGAESLEAFRDFASRARTPDLKSPGWAIRQPWESPENEIERNRVGTLAREAAAGRYGGMTARYFMPPTERLLKEWEMGPTATQPNTLLEYLRNALGL